MATIHVPTAYGYVLTTLSITFANSIFQAFRLPAFRKASGVTYPTLYADSATIDAAKDNKDKSLAIYKYNCAQRAHGNFVENQTQFAVALLIAGLRWPLTSAALGLAWNAFRVVYAIGYTNGAPGGKGRLSGMPAFFCQLGLFGMVAWMGVEALF